jgi:hypothetical protein
MNNDPTTNWDRRAKIKQFLRIASIICFAGCLALAAALVFAWIRSYSRWDGMRGNLGYGRAFEISTFRGGLAATEFPIGDDIKWPNDYSTDEIGDNFPGLGDPPNLDGPLSRFGIACGCDFGCGVTLPYWLLVTVTGSLAFVFHQGWKSRFSLRSLLIVVAFFSIAFGIIGCLAKAL